MMHLKHLVTSFIESATYCTSALFIPQSQVA